METLDQDAKKKGPNSRSPHVKIAAKEKGYRLQRLRHLANLSRREVASRYPEIKHDTLKGWEVGLATGLTEEGAKKVLKVYALEGVICSPEWVLYGSGPGPRLVEQFKSSSDFHDTSNESEESLLFGDKEERQIVRELQFFHEGNRNAIDLIIQDDGMSPHYNKGDWVSGIRRPKSKVRALLGQDCIVQLADGRTLLRHFQVGSIDGRYKLVCLNANTAEESILDNVEVIGAAHVIWVRRRNLPNRWK